jgi:dTDP-4-dehydrorhamnose reductase
MRILVLGLDSPLGYALRSFATPLMRHEIVGVDMDTTRWRRERQVKKLIRRDPIDLILDARLVTQIGGERRRELPVSVQCTGVLRDADSALSGE